MIYTEGNLFDNFENKVSPSVDAIAHVCNCQGVMGSGIALQIKQKYPSAYAIYSKNGQYLNEVTYSEVTHGKYVFNLQAQSNYGRGERHLNYEALYICLERVAKKLHDINISRIGIPYLMGCDRAGGSWQIVEAMVDKVFGDFGIEVLAVKYKN